ncbi:predicted protein [Aspergillus terreus NIH2624]|uniref:Ricin B lectin domain-containing protein n=1 Tax=Aspergillus terreus (strain NIH 2624 / FGSC A1156) TaxID=341663 RepID=Q0CHJ6_ASPTN|nr:uncharacterized protein ATEG_06838 [Aspergillus terreus NIH2624]EAU33382.1 predicted protein [Aspergillus terreus NIH2624]
MANQTVVNPRNSYISTTLDPGTWYRLTNAYLGPSFSLDVGNDGVLKMSPSSNSSGQHWQLLPQFSSGTYKIRSMLLGAENVLDIHGNDKTKPHVAREGNYSGQMWTLDGWGDSTWRLFNPFSGDHLRLDTYADTHEPFMSDGDHSGQHWTLTPIRSMLAPTVVRTQDPKIYTTRGYCNLMIYH